MFFSTVPQVSLLLEDVSMQFQLWDSQWCFLFPICLFICFFKSYISFSFLLMHLFSSTACLLFTAKNTHRSTWVFDIFESPFLYFPSSIMNRHFGNLTCKVTACVQFKFCSVVLKKSSTSFLETLKCLSCLFLCLGPGLIQRLPTFALCYWGIPILPGVFLLIPGSLTFLGLDSSLSYLSETSVLSALLIVCSMHVFLPSLPYLVIQSSNSTCVSNFHGQLYSNSSYFF